MRHSLWVFALVALQAGGAWAGFAEIVSLAGKGEYRQQSASTWREARLKQALIPGDFARTGDLSAMALLFGDKTQMRLAQNSLVQIKDAPDSGETVLELSAGRIWAQARRRTAEPASSQTILTVRTFNAIAGIRGTDWEMAVDEQGRTRLTVLHGEVEFYNELGRVTVRDNEQALAETGKAPVKMLLQNPAERVQWVTSYSVDAARYPELSAAALAGDGEEARFFREIAGLLRAQRLKEAHERLAAWVRSTHLNSAVPFLLLADFAIAGGELDTAAGLLQQGRHRFPDDARLAAQLARVALYRDDAPSARRHVQAGLARHPEAAELKLAQGEIARFEGDAKQAAAAYAAATRLAPGEARGWHGLGAVESEKENLKLARPLLVKALELNENTPGARGELATLETFANNLDAARQHYDLALQAHPDDYVALTGLGLLQLKSGDTEKALETLLKANVIEPKYARAVVYSAIAYYQLGRRRVALETLARAAELDRRDPLPHQLASLIHSDLVEPGWAIDEAREALRLMPYLKSLNQLANDQKGAANLGNALAQFGLEDWALNYAQESYTPFWAGSHLFLADRYGGKFNKNSELMQGYLTDPTAFGASNRFQTLIAKPGNYFSAGALGTRSDDLHTTAPSFIANGYANSTFPFAYFLEGMRVNLIPGAQRLDGDGTATTAALGMLPREDIALFAFASAFEAGVDTSAAPLLGNRLTGWENRLDLGANYKFSPTSQTWLKIGMGEENARKDIADRQAGRNVGTRLDYRPRNQDFQFRHSVRLASDEWSWGLENARMDKEAVLNTVSATSRVHDATGAVDKFWNLYLADRRRFGEQLLLDAGLYYQDYRKTSQSLTTAEQKGLVFSDATGERYARTGFNPRLGLAWTPATGEVGRLAYQKWLRPVAANTLSPVATAGVPLDDQTVLPGGESERLRLQHEREWSAHTYTQLFLNAQRIHNLGQPGNVLNQRQEVADLDRLRNRAALVFQRSGEALEQPPAFLEGRILSAGASVNRRLDSALAAYANYVYSDAKNTHDWFSGLKLPYFPRHRLTLGAAWAGPQRLLVQAQAAYRSQRYTDENNSGELAAGWDVSLKANWQSADKTWLLEAYGLDLLKKDSAGTVGLNVVWRKP